MPPKESKVPSSQRENAIERRRKSRRRVKGGWGESWLLARASRYKCEDETERKRDRKRGEVRRKG